MTDFEKLGVFYLGRPRDPATGATGASPFLYDSKDLTTHGLIVGMTGSGKTGLAIVLLEEAALDGIPAIVIDPKGDMANLALRFPDLRPEDFLPWIDPGEALRRESSSEEIARETASRWRKASPGGDSRRTEFGRWWRRPTSPSTHRGAPRDARSRRSAVSGHPSPRCSGTTTLSGSASPTPSPGFSVSSASRPIRSRAASTSCSRTFSIGSGGRVRTRLSRAC